MLQDEEIPLSHYIYIYIYFDCIFSPKTQFSYYHQRIASLRNIKVTKPDCIILHSLIRLVKGWNNFYQQNYYKHDHNKKADQLGTLMIYIIKYLWKDFGPLEESQCSRYPGKKLLSIFLLQTERRFKKQYFKM